MKRRNTIAAVAALVLALAYASTFVVWSRAGKIGTTTDPKTGQVLQVTWSFLYPPRGDLKVALHRLGLGPPVEPDPMGVWRSREKALEVIFYPCIWLDEKITNRRYLPWMRGFIAWG